jgi:hypothetical protein
MIMDKQAFGKIEITASAKRAGQSRGSRKVLAWILACLILVAGSLALAGCTSQPAGISAKLGDKVTLQLGQTVNLADDTLSIRLVKRVSDSRCPKGAQCIWAGEASCQIDLTYQNQTQSIVLTQPGGGEGIRSLLGYTLTFNIEPYPELNKTIQDKDYRVVLTITQDPAA